MKSVFYKFQAIFLCLCILLCMVPAVSAEAAADITTATTISGSGYDSFGFLTDKNIDSYKASGGDVTISLKNADGMAGLYLLFDLEYGAYTITDDSTGTVFTAGTLGILHEYIDLAAAFGSAPQSVTLRFTSGSVRLSELYVFSEGQLPDFVQVWNAPLDGKADIVLFAAHGDDDQLFFAGLLPYYTHQPDVAVLGDLMAHALLEEGGLSVQRLLDLTLGHAGIRCPGHLLADLLPVDIVPVGYDDPVAIPSFFNCGHE